MEKYLEERLESLLVEEWAKTSHLYPDGTYRRRLTKEKVNELRVAHYRNVGEELDRPNTSHPRQSNIICYGQSSSLKGTPIPPEQAIALVREHFSSIGEELEEAERLYLAGLSAAYRGESTIKCAA